MTEKPVPSEDQRPAANQFTLRGMFIVTTAVCVIMALLTLAIRQPMHWLGMLAVIAFCLVVIGLLELGRLFFPPKPRLPYHLPPVPPNPLQTAYFTDGESPFGSPPSIGQSPFAPASPSAKPEEEPKDDLP